VLHATLRLVVQLHGRPFSTPGWAFQTHGRSFEPKAWRFQPTLGRSALHRVVRPPVALFDPTLSPSASCWVFRPCAGCFGLALACFVHVRLKAGGGDGDVASTNPTVLEFVGVCLSVGIAGRSCNLLAGRVWLGAGGYLVFFLYWFLWGEASVVILIKGGGRTS